MVTFRIFILGIIFTLIGSIYSLGQIRIPIIRDSIRIKGIYMDFEEFKQNNPSIRIDIEAKQTEIFVGFDTHNQYILKIKENQATKIRKVWGFCDGNNIYVREGVNIWRLNQMFNKIDYIGRYCLYKGISTTGGSMISSSNGMMGGGGSRVILNKAINMNNGVDFEISRDYVYLILERDAALLEEYKGDKKKKNHLLDYIRRYSEKHIEEIK